MYMRAVVMTHDCFDHLDKAVRKGRAKYECPIRGADVSLAWVLYQQAIMEAADDL
jgi:hypothetical protein